MPLEVSCPKCGKQLRIPEKNTGGVVSCPACSVKFAMSQGGPVPVAEVLAEEPTGREAPPRPRRGAPPRGRPQDGEGDRGRSERRGWEQVVRGLNRVQFAVWAALVGILCGFGSFLLALLSPFVPDLPLPVLLLGAAGLGLLAYLAALITFILGRMSCLGVPKESRSRGLVTASFLCTTLALVGVVVKFLGGLSFAFDTRGTEGLLVMLGGTAAAGLFSLVAEVLFLVFLYRVGQFLGDGKLSRRVVRTALVAVAVVVLSVLVGGALGFAMAFERASLGRGGDIAPPQGVVASPQKQPPPSPDALYFPVAFAILGVLFWSGLGLEYLGLLRVAVRAVERRPADGGAEA